MKKKRGLWQRVLGLARGSVTRVAVVGSIQPYLLGGARSYNLPPEYVYLKSPWRELLRVSFEPMDAAIWVCPAVHRLSAERQVLALRFAGGAVRPGGVVAIEAMVPPVDGPTPERRTGSFLRAFNEAGIGEPVTWGEDEGVAHGRVVIAGLV